MMVPDEDASEEIVSWLELEQFFLGELSEERVTEVQKALDSCKETRLCLAQIEADADVDLPPLVVPVRQETPGAVGRILRFAAKPSVFYPLSAAAAVLLLLFGLDAFTSDETLGGALGPGGRIKGGDVSFTLVRKRGASELPAAEVFKEGDRFKASVSCPPGGRTELDLAVIQGDQVFFPLVRQQNFACGNNVAMPGAFNLTGRLETRVCLLWGSPLPARASLQGLASKPLSPALRGVQSVCQTLRPAP